MALGFAVVAAADTHIQYLQQHPGWVHDYLEGQRPAEAGDTALIAGWPEQAPPTLGSWSANHRNVELYHWILNGSPALSHGSGALFQVWYEPDVVGHALKLDRHNERFALPCAHLGELAALVANVNLASVKQAFSGWCRARGDNYEPDEMACQPFVDEFETLGRGLQAAMQRGDGIIW